MKPNLPFLSSGRNSETPQFKSFQDLMRFRIRNVLLVSSLYDLFVFEEDGRLYELIRKEYKGLNLSHSPEITRVSSGSEALAMVEDVRQFDLIITTQHIEDMQAVELARQLKDQHPKTPVVLLAYDSRELKELDKYWDLSVFNQVFIWTGDFRIIIAIIKHLEDLRNVDHDSKAIGVQSIILIEDNVLFYSSYLPLLYQIILEQGQHLIIEGVNLSDKYLRMRARPKILLFTNYEQAWEFFKRHEANILGIISDIDFWYNKKKVRGAGLKFAEAVRERRKDIPILLQSNNANYAPKAEALEASFLQKSSPTLLRDVQAFAIQQFGFGDFVFRNPDGKEEGRATDLRQLEKLLRIVSSECLRYHSKRNHFSTWLKARTEFSLAYKLRPRKVSDYPSIEDLRQDLLTSLAGYRKLRQRGTLTDFNVDSFDPDTDLARIGGGSIGGKARGLSFVNYVLSKYHLSDHFQDVRLQIPPGIILCTDVFDTFMDENDLRDFALQESSDKNILERFVQASFFPEHAIMQLRQFLDLFRQPLAVRSSSLLEDSQYHPFAGVYETYMFPNKHPDPEARIQELLITIKRVYASTYFKATKDYIKNTTFRLEEEKMAVIIQKMVGAKSNGRFYPTFAGVAKSYNFYPVKPQTSDDGIVSVALGLGRMVVDGGITVKFSPKYPNHLMQFSSPKLSVKNSQHNFYALDLSQAGGKPCDIKDSCVRLYPLKAAEEDGSLFYVGSTYSHQNEVIYDGLSRNGARLVTFSPILKQRIFPLPQIIDMLLEMGKWGLGTPVEIEFAVNINPDKTQLHDFAVLQIRPLVIKREMEVLHIKEEDDANLICRSESVLGHGVIRKIKDIIFVRKDLFDRSKTVEMAAEIGAINARLNTEGKPYLLIGMGRWGSADPWLGIPVKWEQISGARAIIETNFEDMMVQPSQGSHFFQNLTSFMIGYFTVNAFKNEGFIDWDWLNAQEMVEESRYTRHVRLARPLTIKMNGHNNSGIIIKPKPEPKQKAAKGRKKN